MTRETVSPPSRVPFQSARRIPLPERQPGAQGRETIMPTLLAMRDVMVVLQDQLDRIEDLLMRRPVVIEWRPDHRRIADGGQQVRKQRRAMRDEA